MNPALERAAKALHRNNGYSRPDPYSRSHWDAAWDELFESQREIYRDLVRDVVKEIREPTDGMISAAFDSPIFSSASEMEIRDGYQSMINELLK